MLKDLNDKQKMAFRAMLSGRNIFLSGFAGTGKSFLLNEYIKYLRRQEKNVIVCAPTGIAAINIGGSTLHRTFKIPLRPLGPNEGFKTPEQAIIMADVIIIDEISMCRIDLFNYVLHQLQRAEFLARKTGGNPNKQLIVIGDFMQLPPVLTQEEKEVLETLFAGTDIGNGYAFMSPLWQEKNFLNIVLDKVVRQEDKAFAEALGKLRANDMRGLDWISKNSVKHELPEAINLLATNRAVDNKNTTEMAKLKTPVVTYNASVEGKVKPEEMPTAQSLELKEGARVMTLVNDGAGQYFNGSLGTIVKLEDKCAHVHFDASDAIVKVGSNAWEIVNYSVSEAGKFSRNVIGKFKQLPLKIAYAVTIHKSQGQTFDKVNLNPYSFASGQLYVALTRVRAIEGLHLSAWLNPSYLKFDKETREFYTNLSITEDFPETAEYLNALANDMELVEPEPEQEVVTETASRRKSMYVSAFTRVLNDKYSSMLVKPLNYRNIVNWLIAEGYIYRDEKNSMIALEKGEAIGIHSKLSKAGTPEEKYVTMYSPEAQDFLEAHIQEFSNPDNAKSVRKEPAKLVEVLADADIDAAVLGLALAELKPQEEAMNISTFTGLVNEKLVGTGLKKIKTTFFTDYLVENGIIRRVNNITLVLNKGERYGIHSEASHNSKGDSYNIILYPARAQKLLIDYVTGVLFDKYIGKVEEKSLKESLEIPF